MFMAKKPPPIMPSSPTYSSSIVFFFPREKNRLRQRGKNYISKECVEVLLLNIKRKTHHTSVIYEIFGRQK